MKNKPSDSSTACCQIRFFGSAANNQFVAMGIGKIDIEDVTRTKHCVKNSEMISFASDAYAANNPCAGWIDLYATATYSSIICNSPGAPQMCAVFII